MFQMRGAVKLMVAILTSVALGCGGYTSGQVGEITQQDRISECGGFLAASDKLFADPPDDYCAAERLHWSYHTDTQTLSLADARVLLNCCGEHSMTIEDTDGVYLVTVRDAPQQIPGIGDARCACMCVFDFTLEATGIPEGIIQLRLVHEVTDWPGGSGVVFEGELDLSQGAGSFVVDETDVGPWCEQDLD